VSPYIPSLLKLLDYYLYVDVCSTVLIFLYLFKYLFKGPDQARFNIHNNEEDIITKFNNYLNGQYLSVSEAIYRILGFKTVYKSPSVCCLPIHLPGRNLSTIQRLDAVGYSDMSDLL
jgi:hypothetical protein